jgi:hypothetical protein
MSKRGVFVVGNGMTTFLKPSKSGPSYHQLAKGEPILPGFHVRGPGPAWPRSCAEFVAFAKRGADCGAHRGWSSCNGGRRNQIRGGILLPRMLTFLFRLAGCRAAPGCRWGTSPAVRLTVSAAGRSRGCRILLRGFSLRTAVCI